ncbi:tRNA (adenosine(37)-N6)-threonylcarbamoyltransferase complex dimerization subunit type 1 TsaB [Tindallia californiensis]|uniref:tRNA threonylcarbamoyladenosine biosynthesis protein TsaB n=1 Tax=Tindallia californiensis TaxID=159292 RepID=A0A1H3L7L7_9FIRM|nr:tRNA (adenosine(37)-N6)-threonylcarbamoyltransferase complex dimerization subunit type 1 TsaB [Tindallia californiensis]SDY60507.1 tRNA threonylcarbamoyladenosine biosynthesis protein TsaB [Tindallia californiensis]
MKCLAMESSSMVAAVALMEKNRLVGEIRTHYKKTHSERLLPMMDQLLTSCESTLREVDFFAANIGPGSFTGIRIGTGTVKGLAHALQKPVVAVNSLEALAAQNAHYAGWCIPMIDAQKNLVYTAAYEFQNGEWVTHQPPDVFHLLEWMEILKKRNHSFLFSGDAVEIHGQRIKSCLGQQAAFADSLHNSPSAASVALCAMKKAEKNQFISSAEMRPLYLRTSQAERAWKQKQEELKGIQG